MSFKCWKNETFAWRADRAVKWQLSLSVQDNFRQIKRCKISTEKMRGIYSLNSFNLAGIVVFTGFLNAGGFACLFILMSSCITLCCFCCIYCRNPKIHNWLKTSMKKCFLFFRLRPCFDSQCDTFQQLQRHLVTDNPFSYQHLRYLIHIDSRSLTILPEVISYFQSYHPTHFW